MDGGGLLFLAGRPQYMQTVPVVLGGQVTDGVNPTSFTVIRCDVFVRNTSFSMRPSSQIAQNLLTFTMGVKTGSIAGGNLGGVDGGSFFTSTSHVWSCNMGVYGSMMVCAGGNFVFNNSAANIQEFGASLINHNGSATFNLATSVTPNFYFLNSACTTARGSSGAMFNNFNAQSVEGSVLCLNNLDYFVNAANGRAVRKARLSGVTGKPAKCDIRFLTGGEVTEVVWSGTAPLRVVNSSGVDLFPVKEYWGFDCKVVDGSAGGAPLEGIPVFLESDIETFGNFSQLTEADGNVVFTDPTTGVDNNVVVREHYGADASTDTGTLNRDRTYTLTVNGYADPGFTPNPNYETVVQQFEWPGRDRAAAGGYATDGGTFKRVMTIVKLRRGSPTGNPIYTECEVP